jgi:hypothetical protein
MEDYELKNYVQSRGDETRALEPLIVAVAGALF